MSTTTGKKARKACGNRYACRRRAKAATSDKRFADNVKNPEQYQKEKHPQKAVQHGK